MIFKEVITYNDSHLHSGIGYVTLSQRHRGNDIALLAQRDAVYRAAKAIRPERWSGKTRNWQRKATVTLNPEREKQAA